MAIKRKEFHKVQHPILIEPEYTPSQEYKDIMKALQELRQLLA